MTTVQQDISALLDIDGDQVGKDYKIGVALEFAPRPKYLRVDLRQQLVLKSPRAKHGGKIEFGEPVPATLIINDRKAKTELFRLPFDVTVT